MAADDTEAYPSTEDRIVAEFGDGYDMPGIAARHGLTVAQVYAVLEREVGSADQDHPVTPGSYPPPPGYHPPPPAYAPAGYAAQVPGFPPSQAIPDEDAIVAEYGGGRDVEEIARRHGIDVEQVYAVIQRVVTDDPGPPAGPTWPG